MAGPSIWRDGGADRTTEKKKKKKWRCLVLSRSIEVVRCGKRIFAGGGVELAHLGCMLTKENGSHPGTWKGETRAAL